ncbi:MAG: hypothetical protein IJU10_04590 [Clostridia bacterium]|nr:hypothetical protein [Clostridia bacterium]
MAYLQEFRKKIAEVVGAPVPEVQILGRTKCIVAGHKGLYSLSEDEVVIRRWDGRLLLRGRGLHVEDADEEEIRIGGEILAVEFAAE